MTLNRPIGGLPVLGIVPVAAAARVASLVTALEILIKDARP